MQASDKQGAESASIFRESAAPTAAITRLSAESALSAARSTDYYAHVTTTYKLTLGGANS